MKELEMDEDKALTQRLADAVGFAKFDCDSAQDHERRAKATYDSFKAAVAETAALPSMKQIEESAIRVAQEIAQLAKTARDQNQGFDQAFGKDPVNTHASLEALKSAAKQAAEKLKSLDELLTKAQKWVKAGQIDPAYVATIETTLKAQAEASVAKVQTLAKEAEKRLKEAKLKT